MAVPSSNGSSPGESGGNKRPPGLSEEAPPAVLGQNNLMAR